MDVPIIISATEAKPEMMAVLAWQVVWTQYLVDSLTFTKVSMQIDITGRICIIFSLHQWNKHTKYNLSWMIYLCYFLWFISHVYNRSKYKLMFCNFKHQKFFTFCFHIWVYCIAIFYLDSMILIKTATNHWNSNFQTPWTHYGLYSIKLMILLPFIAIHFRS